MGGHVTGPHRYDYAIDPNGESTANKVLRRVGRNRRVLELGTALGVMTRAMKEQGCSVTGIEIDPALAEEASRHCERMIVADLDQIDLADALGGARFEVIVAADVLEHLRDPRGILEKARAVIEPDGLAVLSIPNVAHASIVASLLCGRFDYCEKGLLDRTHLRFFTRSGIEDMLLAAGWLPIAWETHRVPPLETELAGHWLAQPPHIRGHLAMQPEADVYQFIVTAAPAGETGWQVLLRSRTHELEEGLHATQAELERRNREHEATVADLREHQKAFAEARNWIGRLQEELDETKKALGDKQTELEKAVSECASLAGELEALRRSSSEMPLLARLGAVAHRLLDRISGRTSK